MFAQFRTLYPTGQLISELVTIYQGKFVVRTLIQLDGKTVATAMSAGDTVELAEDRSWTRSLSILGLNSSVSVPAPVTTPDNPLYTATNRDIAREDIISTAPTTAPKTVPAPLPQIPHRDIPLPTENPSIPQQGSFVNRKTQENEPTNLPAAEPIYPAPAATSVPPVPKQLDSDAWLSSSYGVSPLGQESSAIPSPISSSKSETEFPSVTHSSAYESEVEPQSTFIEANETPLEISPPSEVIEDNSETIAQIDVLLKRLKWKKEQESEYLLQAYGKLSQGLLARHELLDFLEYLEIFSKTSDEIVRLGWDTKQGRDYLNQAYGKLARHQLNKEQLLDFLQYLESQ
ncbi:MAG TPA: hypothetical protein VK211_10840 [Kamptonema sp.]|nr:hypothetical protein [Kamptonema sp.]